MRRETKPYRHASSVTYDSIAISVGFKAPHYHETAKSAFWMSLEYAEYVEPASPESARGYEDKRLQCNPQKGQPQHSLMPGVPTSPPHTPFHSSQHKVTSANAFSILMQASRSRIIKSKNLKREKKLRKDIPRITYSLFLTLCLCLPLSLAPSPSFSFCFNPSSSLTNCTACFFHVWMLPKGD